MIGRLTALILLSTLSQSTDNRHKIPLTVAELGDNLNLTCKISGDEAGLIYWYKLKFGYMVQTVAGGSLFKLLLQGQFNNPRFAVTKINDLIFLHINNVCKEDEATYFCQMGAAYNMKFNNGTVLVVNDHKNQQKSVYVKQIPETASVQPGNSVSLQCSLLSKCEENSVQCPGEHKVYWFRAGSGGSHPSIIYTHRNSSDEQEKRSCDYSLSKTIRDSSDDGTYYCAVATCGEIIFGNGAKVEIEQTASFEFKVLLIAIICFVISLIGNIVFICYVTSGPTPKGCKGKQSDTSQARHDDSFQPVHDITKCGDDLDYTVLHFSGGNAKRRRKTEELSVCVYKCKSVG